MAIHNKKSYRCRPGNHACYRADIAVLFDDSGYGICYDCIKRRLQHASLRDYWIKGNATRK